MCINTCNSCAKLGFVFTVRSWKYCLSIVWQEYSRNRSTNRQLRHMYNVHYYSIYMYILSYRYTMIINWIAYSLCSLFFSLRVKVRGPVPGSCTSTHSSFGSYDPSLTHPIPAVVSASVFTGSGCEGCEGGGVDERGLVGVGVRREGCGFVKSCRGVCPNSLTWSSIAASSLGSWIL